MRKPSTFRQGYQVRLVNEYVRRATLLEFDMQGVNAAKS
jgi:hypothetical protein